jgi:hypothetical protein
MMAITRNELKDLIKECILEVMLEGIKPNESPRQVVEQARKPSSPPVTSKKHLDSISFSTGASRVAEQAQGRRQPPPVVADLASAFPKEQRDIMQQIFEDTARNTLPSQMTAERNPAAAAHMTATTGVDPMSIFEGASNWADLAFADAKKV